MQAFRLTVFLVGLLACSAIARAANVSLVWRFGPLVSGSAPIGGLVADKSGALYGATYYGGSGGGSGFGVIYKLTPPTQATSAWTQTVLYSFNVSSDGLRPVGELTIGLDGALYGAASEAGLGYGTIFRLAPPIAPQQSWRYEVIYRFNSRADGVRPLGPFVFDEGGVLYGVTNAGGDTALPDGPGFGTLFSLTPPRTMGGVWKKRTLRNFGHGRGPASPSGGLTRDGSGAIYGLSYSGGDNSFGTAFRYVRDAKCVWRGDRIHSFGHSRPGISVDGERPGGTLAHGSDGSVYGATWFGNDAALNGAIFQLSPRAGSALWTEKIIYAFGNNSYNGYMPNGVILDGSGNLYGTTLGGGARLNGSLFLLTPPQDGVGFWRKTILHSFAGGRSDGSAPVGALLNLKGKLYGVTQHGGPSQAGTVFKYFAP